MMRGRTYRQALLGIVLLAGILRGLYFAEMVYHPERLTPVQDEAFHHYWAKGWATGDWTPPPGEDHPRITERAFFRPPLYAALLSVVYRVAGPRPIAMVQFQILLGLLNLLLLFSLARRLKNAEAAVEACVLYLFYAPLLFYEARLLDVTPGITLLLTALLCDDFHRQTRKPVYVWITGLTLGLMCLLRPVSLVLLPLWGGALVRRTVPSVRQAVRIGSLALASVFLVIAPVTLRNFLKEGAFVPISSNGGLMFLMGNRPGASGATETGGLSALIPGHYRSCFDYEAMVRDMDALDPAAVDMTNTYADVSSRLFGKGWTFWAEQPVGALSLTARKARLSFSPVLFSHNRDPHFAIRESRVLQWLALPFSLILAGALLGMALPGVRKSCLRPRLLWAIGLTAALLFIVYWPFVISTQYREPVMPLLMLMCGITFSYLTDQQKQQQYLKKAFVTAAWIVLTFVLSLNHAGVLPNLAQHELQMAYSFRQLGQTDRAEAVYERIVARVPGHAWAQGQLGSLKARKGHLREALTHFERALAVEPDYPRVRVQAAYALYLTGRVEEGIDRLLSVLADHPSNVEALNALALIASADPNAHGQFADRGLAWAQRAAHLTGRTDPAVLDTLAAVHAARGEWRQAVEIQKCAMELVKEQQPEFTASYQERLERYLHRSSE